MHVAHGLVDFPKKTKSKLQILQNKMIAFVIGLPSRSHISINEFKTFNGYQLKTSRTDYTNSY